MKTVIALYSIILAAACLTACRDEAGPPAPETPQAALETGAGRVSWPLPKMGGGAYALRLTLSAEAPFRYVIRIMDRNSEKIIAETKAFLNVRPLPYYCDERHFVMLVGLEEGDWDGLYKIPYQNFLVFDLADVKFRRYGTKEPEIFNFQIIGNKLYSGNHVMESPNGSLTIIDLETGATLDIGLYLDGAELKRIEAWAPSVGLNAEGEIRVWWEADETGGRLYRIEKDHLVFAEHGRLEPFRNPELPLR